MVRQTTQTQAALDCIYCFDEISTEAEAEYQFVPQVGVISPVNLYLLHILINSGGHST